MIYKYNTLQSGGRWEDEMGGLFHLKGKAHLLPPFACFSLGGFLEKDFEDFSEIVKILIYNFLHFLNIKSKRNKFRIF